MGKGAGGEDAVDIYTPIRINGGDCYLVGGFWVEGGESQASIWTYYE